jgi:hypothetical protein
MIYFNKELLLLSLVLRLLLLLLMLLWLVLRLLLSLLVLLWLVLRLLLSLLVLLWLVLRLLLSLLVLSLPGFLDSSNAYLTLYSRSMTMPFSVNFLILITE